MKKKWEIENRDGYRLIKNDGGKTLGISEHSTVPIIEQDGFAFKNLSKSGKLEPYEDWRLSVSERAHDLAHKLDVRQIAGLMLYSKHQMIPSVSEGLGKHFSALYAGKPFEESGAMPWDMTDEQKEFLQKDGVRHILVMGLKDAVTTVRWYNRVQAYVENLDFGVPVNNSSDPRHGINKDAEYNGGGCEALSKWANGIGFAATFDKELVYEFGKAAAREYRALGITTALSPQIDLATDPRWMRFCDTFGEHTQLTTDLTKAYCDGFQTSFGDQEIGGGWGYESVNTMVKHFPGGGTCESGRDSHYAYGKFGVYPGDCFEEHLKPFENGAFRLDGPTGCASAIMPYYSIPYDQDTKYHENVGNSYSQYIIQDLLRRKYGYDGVVCTDWDITGDYGKTMEEFNSRCWGVEALSVAERHLKIIMNGVDQFGGNQAIEPILEAYALGCERYGEDVMNRRFAESAVRLLTNIFRLGLFENPYLDEAESDRTVGKKEFAERGFLSQLKSIVMLKNKHQVLPLKKGINVFVPEQHRNPYPDFFSCMTKEETKPAIARSALEACFTPVDTPEMADVAICFMDSPISCGYSAEDKAAGGSGYVPVTLQYRPYTAKTARSVSIAGGHPLEDGTNRSYRGKCNTAANESDLDQVLEMRKRMGDKPVVVVLTMKNPTVMKEFEPYADAILVEFGVSREAILTVLTGGFEPEGLLPLQIPADMEIVEQQKEDVPFDMECHVDEEGNVYDFTYGLNFKGVIDDQRVRQYSRKKSKETNGTSSRAQ